MCWKCGNSINEEEIYRSSVCSFCGTELHSCRNCVFYSPGAHYDCRETVDERITEKERANFCGYFSVKREFEKKAGGNENSSRDAFNSLFGN